MQKFPAILLLGLSLPAAAAGGGGGARSGAGHPAPLSGVGRADAAWAKAFKAEDADAVTKCYAPDAVVWVTGAPVARGSKEIKAEYTDYFAAYSIKSVSVTELGSTTIGSESVGWGTFTITAQPKAGGAAATEIGRYTEVAKRVGGRWVYKVDQTSDDPAPEPAGK